MNSTIRKAWVTGAILAFVLAASHAHAGIYSIGIGDSANPNPYDEPIPGFVGFDGDGNVTFNNYVNPAFIGWATGYQDYLPTPGVDPGWQTPEETLGEVTGDNMDIVSLGDLNQSQIDAGVPPGEITLTFDTHIGNGVGTDFAVFENAFISLFTIPETGSVASELFGEFAFVEVSTDGLNFARFGSVSETDGLTGSYGTLDPSDVYNLAGKNPNGYGYSWGTPFDLDDLLDDDFVQQGLVNLNDIGYVRFVDIPGSGDFLDSVGDPIYDAWVTWGSGGFDLEAVGVLNTTQGSVVPEPASISLVALGLAGMALRRVRKRR
jgi:PEP-CTERM motif-containing protein